MVREGEETAGDGKGDEKDGDGEGEPGERRGRSTGRKRRGNRWFEKKNCFLFVGGFSILGFDSKG